MGKSVVKSADANAQVSAARAPNARIRGGVSAALPSAEGSEAALVQLEIGIESDTAASSAPAVSSS